MEIYQALKLLEQEQAEILKKQSEPEFIENEKKITDELQEYTNMLAEASRADAKRIRERIVELKQQKHKFQNELSDIED